LVAGFSILHREGRDVKCDCPGFAADCALTTIAKMVY
jgi:hypothetical protein